MRHTARGTGTVRRPRSRPSGRPAGRLVAALAAACALGTPALAAPATAAERPVAPPAAPSPEAQRAAAHWTAARMRAAHPIDLLAGARREPTAAAARAAAQPPPAVLRGRESTVAPALPSPASRSFPQPGGPWTGGGKVVQTAGRVFFTYKGRPASCSGDAVAGKNGSTVLTAGHCVKLDGAWHTDWIFVPGYHDGRAPYGKWAAARTLSTPQWTASENIDYDVGAAVVAPLDGKRLTDVVGGQGVSFNSGYHRKMYAFGYPAAAPYDGTRLIHCSGTTTKDPFSSKDHGLPCNMTGGSSGGPWFRAFDEKTGTGLQASVNSFGYTFLPNTMFGPYFGNDAKNLYDKAQAS